MKLIREIWSALPFQVRVIAFAAIGVIVIFLVVMARIDSCSTHREERRIANTKEEIQKDAIEANVLANQKVEVEINANKANANLGNVLGTDTANRESDFGTVRRKFCADHPNDSKCRK